VTTWKILPHSDFRGVQRIPPDPGCLVCTHGVTPDHYNTGLCMLHQAERLIPGLRKR